MPALASDFRLMLETFKRMGVPHFVHHAPCAGKGKIGKDDAIQQAMLDFGHNITSHCTTGIQVGDEMLVFFTGAGDVCDVPAGSFIFRFNVKSRKIEHNTIGLKVVARGD